MSTPAWVYTICGTELVFLAIANVSAFVPTIVRVFLLKNVESLHKDPVSDIPGNPHAFSPAIISLFRTLPEPSNFNIVWTGLNLSEPLLIRGDIPISRFSSISVYGAGSSDPPESIELNKSIHNAEFDVIVAHKDASIKSPTCTQMISCGDSKKGFIAMRNYLVPPGTRVMTPEIVRLSDGVVVRSSYALTSGPCGLDLRFSKFAQSAFLALQVNITLFVWNFLIFDQILSPWFLFGIALVGAVLGGALYQLCFIIGRKRLKQFTKDICLSDNAMYFASLEQGAKASQPSKLHKYWMMRHDIPANGEVVVRVRINPALQKYWSLVVYDEYGLPLPQYIYDDNCLKNPAVLGADHSDSAVYDVDIRLRNGCNPPDRATQSEEDNVNIVDVSSCARGYVLFRINHPVDEQVTDFSAPTAHINSSSGIHSPSREKED